VELDDLTPGAQHWQKQQFALPVQQSYAPQEGGF
jgi:hypothetical protein